MASLYDRMHCNRSKWCNCCGEKIRVQKKSPSGNDPDFLIAICPKCDVGV